MNENVMGEGTVNKDAINESTVNENIVNENIVNENTVGKVLTLKLQEFVEKGFYTKYKWVDRIGEIELRIRDRYKRLENLGLLEYSSKIIKNVEIDKKIEDKWNDRCKGYSENNNGKYEILVNYYCKKLLLGNTIGEIFLKKIEEDTKKNFKKVNDIRGKVNKEEGWIRKWKRVRFNKKINRDEKLRKEVTEITLKEMLKSVLLDKYSELLVELLGIFIYNKKEFIETIVEEAMGDMEEGTKESTRDEKEKRIRSSIEYDIVYLVSDIYRMNNEWFLEREIRCWVEEGNERDKKKWNKKRLVIEM